MTYRLIPACKDYVWGGHKLKDAWGKVTDSPVCAESWELSCHPAGLCRVEGGRTLAEVLTPADLGPACRDRAEFPVLVKLIDAAERLSVQVHPTDAYARVHEGASGKTEMWYVAEAEEGACIYCGFRGPTDPAQFRAKVADGTVEDLLRRIPVRAGDCYLIPAGTVHAIGRGCLICEIQQNSDVTYRVYDWGRVGLDGRPRPLHVDRAMEVIRFGPAALPTPPAAEAQGGVRLLADCPHFRVRELTLRGRFETRDPDSFLSVTAVAGQGKVNGLPFRRGDSFFISAGEAVCLTGKGTLLMTDVHDQAYFAGVDIGGTFIKCGIVSERGDLLTKAKIPTEAGSPPDVIAGRIADCVRGLADEAGVTLSGCGIGCPGTIDSARGVVVYSNNIAWRDVPLAEAVGARLGVPVKMTNDANAAALGEYSRLRECYDSIVFVTLGTGVGGGIVLGGRLFEGFRSAGAEIGHQVIRVGGEKCTCGRRGCWETYASAGALVRQTRAAMSRDPGSLLWQSCGGEIDRVDGFTVFDAYYRGDATARKVVKKYLSYLAEGIVNVINCFRPQAVVVGGGISAEGDAIIKPLRRKVKALLYGGCEYAPVQIEAARLRNDAGLIGAGLLCRE